MIAMIHASAHSHLCNTDMLLLYPRMPNAHTMISSLRVRRTHYACSQVQLLLLPRLWLLLLVVLRLQLWLSLSVVVAGAAVVAVSAVTAAAAVFAAAALPRWLLFLWRLRWWLPLVLVMLPML
jgi:hypothetical protein